MCCRYYIEKEDPELQAIGEAASRTPLRFRFIKETPLPLRTEGEVSPGVLASVIASSKNGNKFFYPMAWGFNLDGRKMLPNARLETAALKPTFQAAWKSHRCVIPASYYFEWEHFLRPNGKTETGRKYLIQTRDEHITWLCGIYRMEAGLPHFVILTRPPVEEISFIHDRMPLIIREKDVDAWIDPGAKPEEIAYRAVTDLYFEKVI